MSAPALARLRGARLAHLIESDGPGGAERMLASLVTELQRAGAENLVIVPERGEGWLAEQLRGTGAKLATFHLERPLSPACARGIADTLRRHRTSLAHSHEFSMAVYGAWAARGAGARHLFTMHGSRYYAERLRRRLAVRAAADLSGAVVAVSAGLASDLRRDLWLGERRVTLVPNGAAPPRATAASFRRELGLTDRDQLALAVGNLYPVKGHVHLVGALGRLADRFPRLHVAIAGRGDQESALRERAVAVGVSDRLHLVGLRSDVGDLLAGADVYVMPSLSEGLPIALLEAMVAARPIVASAVGDIPAALAEGNAGILTDPGDSASLAEGLAAVLGDSALAHRLGAAAAARAAAEYSLATMVERYAAIYASLLPAGAIDGLPRPRFADPVLETEEVVVAEAAVGRQRH